MVLVGHGWGHGRGMGQWGALGYAIGQDGGLGPQTYQQILAHYYAPATLQPDPAYGGDAPAVRVALVENNDNFLIAYAPQGLTVPGTNAPSPPATSPAVMFQPLGGEWAVFVSSSCAGNPTGAPWTFVGTTGSPVTQAVDAASGGQVQLCLTSGNLSVHGQLEAVLNSNGARRSVNVVSLGQYLDGVVPSESPASWGSLGGPGPQNQAWGFQELEAQAVAARSYVLSSLGSYGGYADTCDTTACQVYAGTRNETSLSDLAVADTAGQVMYLPGATVPARTEFSSSTGGYTSPSSFQAVPDVGDALCVPGACNPNHTWQLQVPVTQVESAWPQVGALQSVTVVARNGLGDLGGRALSVMVQGASGSVTVT
ncbi:MAG TPA: SpoIID/LytB domain-containing protein, partial [Acidimicrobiales bacterium]|nr:SpoIID/LytB domain-containing protein [Acidimicrobiales bacterium]